MNKDHTPRQNRIRETLDRLYDQHPPHFREQLRRLQEDPTSRVFAPLAESYRRMGRIEEAIEMCQVGLQHHPDFHGGRVALAKCFIDKQRYQDAQFELEKVIQLAPENLLAQRLLGEALLAQGQEKQALHAFKMALLLAPCDIGLTDKIHHLEKKISSEGASLAPHPDSLPQPETSEEFVTSETLSVMESSKSTDVPALTAMLTTRAPQSASEMEEPDEGQEWELGTQGSDQFDGSVDEERDDDDPVSQQVNAVLGFKEETEDVFTVGSVHSAFEEATSPDPVEITTETLGDLYFSQGQFGNSLKIFEKIYRVKPNEELARKIKACRMRLGVDKESVTRNKKIELLKGLLEKVQQNSEPSE